MTYITKLACGIILITIPTIEYGGYFLLTILSGKQSELGLTPFQQAMFRAGHAHAGSIVILSLICQLLTDYAVLPVGLQWLVRIGIPISALLVSGGFFGSAAGRNVTQPTRLVVFVYAGAGWLAVCLILLGVGLIRSNS